jgi:hypothetical protein
MKRFDTSILRSFDYAQDAQDAQYLNAHTLRLRSGFTLHLDVAGARKVALPIYFCKDKSVKNTFHTGSQVLYNHYGWENV